ncbi:MAG: sigma-54 dependent transcriptional regulator [Candidatus Zixiibacteriota bacterium]
MISDVVILTDEKQRPATGISWASIGTPVTTMAQVYQLVRERTISLVLVDLNRHDVNQAVAIKIRRPNGLTDIWKLVESDTSPHEVEPFFDGAMPSDLGTDGIAKRISQIISDKKLLEKYGIIGRSRALRALAGMIDRIAPTDVSVLIVGPSGSGKELVARAVHQSSSRSKGPFVTINCGAISEGLLESELFGHEKGAFTGSVGKRDGLFRKAEGGTIFLDEIGETKPDMQVKLLRVLEDGTFYPVGSSVPERANVRVVAATNRDLTEAIADRRFREDLYFRISAVKLVVPPLLERRGDIQPLLQHFWRDQKGLDYSGGALERLMKYDWPGNVRQLRNFASRMAALKPAGLVETDDVEKFLAEQHAAAQHLPVSTGRTAEEAGQELIYRAILSLGNEIRLLRNLITANLPGEQPVGSAEPMGPDSLDANTTMEEMEEALIQQVLQQTGGNRKETARRLGIGERTLYRKLAKFGLR